jgi:hypothetical protein
MHHFSLLVSQFRVLLRADMHLVKQTTVTEHETVSAQY